MIEDAFGGRYVGEIHRDGHRMDAPPGYFTFAIVRDPLERLESMFKHHADLFPDRPESRDFGLFVRGAVAGTNDGGWPNFNKPQSWWLATCPNPATLLRLSHLQADLEALALHDGPFVVPRLNARPRVPVAWTAELAALAAAWGRDDPRG